MSEFFGRKIELLFKDLKLTNEFFMTFDIPFDDGPDINIAEIKVYNLLDTTINKIKKDGSITVNAGYANDVGVILSGKIKKVRTTWEGVDKATAITVADINDTWLTKNVSKTYKKDITAKQILIDILKAAGVKVGQLSLPTNKVYKGGKTIKGPVGKTVSDIVPDCNAKAHFTRGAAYISGRNQGTKTDILISKDSGLISSPTPITKTEQYSVNKTVVKWVEKGSGKKKKKVKKIEYKEDTKTRTLNGYKVQMLLNHRIKTDSIIRIQSRTANGNFRVAAGVHNGADFITEVEVFPV